MLNKTSNPLRQRADYTHKFNTETGRHGWLRLTPAYSVKIVEEIVRDYKAPKTVLDPFCGTGTTAISAIDHGHSAATIDINPFLVWLTRAKTAHYSAETLSAAESAGRMALNLALREAVEAISPPSMYRIERWWTPRSRRFLCLLKAAISRVAGATEAVSDLLLVAFCRTLIRISNAAFNHQSMSFKNGAIRESEFDREANFAFLDDLNFVLQGAAENPTGDASVILGDARLLPDYFDARFDAVITSPPYANRMSYIRELRPYMYWLNHLTNGRDAGEMDWLAIGGTWGIATSRLASWSAAKSCWLPGSLKPILASISRNNHKSGFLLANYVARYCEDMSRHFDGLRQVLNPGAHLRYIIGNSAFYGILVPVEQIYAAMLREYGFRDVNVRPIRKRNSKKELVEFDVSATWQGCAAL